MNLLSNNEDSNILFKNDEVIVFEQEGIKWIVTKDNEFLMTVKDIGLLGGNLKKTERYELDLKKKGFISPHILNDSILIYEEAIKTAIIGNKHGNLPILYNYPAITQIIAELRTDIARSRNQQLGMIQEELRTKGYFKLKENDVDELIKLRKESKSVQKTFNKLFTYAIDFNKSTVGFRIARIQNKLYQAITGYTNAELIYNRVDHEKENVNVETWTGKNGPIKKDMDVGKNYLVKNELDSITNMYMSSAIQYVINKKLANEDFTEKELEKFVDKSIELFTDGKSFTGSGKILMQKARDLAIEEYNKWKMLLPQPKKQISS